MQSIGAITRLDPAKLMSLLSSGAAVQLVDVRTPLEFDGEHIQESKNIPLDELAKRGAELKQDCTTVLICRSGGRALRAAEMISSYGREVSILEGGLSDWRKAGFALKEGRKRLSLERQVQLTIGILLLSSVSAGCFLDKAWLIVPAFIGAGLTFAGLTGNCGLALLLAKAPWNKLDVNKTGACKF